MRYSARIVRRPTLPENFTEEFMDQTSIHKSWPHIIGSSGINDVDEFQGEHWQRFVSLTTCFESRERMVKSAEKCWQVMMKRGRELR